MSDAARHERGMVTAELAVAVPAVVLVLALCLGAVRVAVDQVRCVDAARIAARAAARGDPVDRVVQLGRSAAPEGATVEVVAVPLGASVTVSAPAGGWAGLPSWTLRAVAVTPVEVPP